MESVSGFCDTAKIWPSWPPTTHGNTIPWRLEGRQPVPDLHPPPKHTTSLRIWCGALPAQETTAGGIEGTGAPCFSQRRVALWRRHCWTRPWLLHQRLSPSWLNASHHPLCAGPTCGPEYRVPRALWALYRLSYASAQTPEPQSKHQHSIQLSALTLATEKSINGMQCYAT